ncbi:hypothetical protein BJV74DRAFT_476743 [Russula compacta]|nr:hypothetical protein BJV74DRAFT_476743 [Russula compacta]
MARSWAPAGFLYRVDVSHFEFCSHFPRSFSYIVADRDWPHIESKGLSHVSRLTVIPTLSDWTVGYITNFSWSGSCWFSAFKRRACREESCRYLHLQSHRCLPFTLFMFIFRRCWSSRPSTVSGRCVSRHWLHGYVHTLIDEKKNAPSEGWSIQSWRSQKAVAIGCIHPTCSGVGEGCQLPSLGLIPGGQCLGG